MPLRAPALVALLLAPAVAGCLGATEPLAAGGARGGPLDRLAAEQPARVDRAADAVAFAWEGTTGLYAAVALVGEFGYAPEHRFTIGPGVGAVEAVARAGGGVRVALRDDAGTVACAAAGVGEAACSVPAPPGLDRVVTWGIQVASGGDPSPGPRSSAVDAGQPKAYEAQVTVRAGPAAALGDVGAGVDPALRFAGSVVQPGGEPTLGATSSGAIFVAGTTGDEGPTVHRSRDQGATWEDVTPPLNDALSFDPFLYVDARTGRVLVSHLNIACSLLSWSDDEGASWTTAPAGCDNPVQDHQKVGVGGAALPASVYDGTIYYSENHVWAVLTGVNATALVVHRSLDGGATWTNTVAHTSLAGWYRTGGPVMADLDGDVYVPMYLRGETTDVAVVVSRDFGVTWQTVVASRNGTGSRGIDPDVAIDRAGNAYVVHEGADGHVWMAASRDRGATWGEPVRVSPEGVRSGMFPVAIAGDEGRLAVAYYGTPDTSVHGNDAPPWARWHLYVTYVDDAASAPTMRTALATPPGDPAQIGSICTRGIACAGGGTRRNLADFIDASMLPDGRVIVAWTDGCLEACTRASESLSSMVTVSVQQEGPGLLEAPGDPPGRQRNVSHAHGADSGAEG